MAVAAFFARVGFGFAISLTIVSMIIIIVTSCTASAYHWREMAGHIAVGAGQ